METRTGQDRGLTNHVKFFGRAVIVKYSRILSIKDARILNVPVRPGPWVSQL